MSLLINPLELLTSFSSISRLIKHLGLAKELVMFSGSETSQAVFLETLLC